MKDFLYFVGMNGEDFERLFLEEALRQGEKKFGSARAFAVAIWPHRDARTAGQTLYNMRNGVTKTGKPQSLKLSEAVRMVELLGETSFAAFCFEVTQLLLHRQKSIAESDATASPKGGETLPPPEEVSAAG